MNVIDVIPLAIEEVRIIRYARFIDHRGFFGEHYRKSDTVRDPRLGFLKEVEFLQCNESWSRPGTLRGLHFQWNPFMGKLVRTLRGRMIDMVMDIRKGSPSFGRIVLYPMRAGSDDAFGEWIWVPPGFAHGNFFTEETHIEYFCSGEYNPECEAGISPLADDIDWRLCDASLRKEFELLISAGMLISDKDRNGHTLKEWIIHPASENFVLDAARRP